MQNKKLNICIITGDFPSLTETFVTNKVLELQRRGHQVTVIKNSGGGSVNESHLEQVKRSGIDVTTIHDLSTLRKTANVLSRHSGVLFSSLSTSRSHLKTRLRANLQAKLLTAKPFDIIHFEFSGLAISWMNAIKKVGAKTVVSCRGTAEKVKPISDSKRKEDLKKLFAVVDAIHCVSQDMAQTIMPFCNSPEKIFVNRPSIDAELFKRTKPTPVNAIVTILTIGRFTFQKGYLPALMAVNELKKKEIAFKWKIVGDGPQREELMYHLHAMKLDDYVELVGKKNRDEILHLYNEVDIFFLPSVYEGIANVCLEAMAMELPVLCTKSGGMEEVITHGEDGLLCNVYDLNDMVEKLETIIADKMLRKKLGPVARQTIINRFTLQRQADEFEEEYRKLLNIPA